MARDICPMKRNRCRTADICGMLFCAAGGARLNQHPISERDLTKAERYELTISEQRKARAP